MAHRVQPTNEGETERLNRTLGQISRRLAVQDAALGSAHDIASNSEYDLYDFCEQIARVILELMEATIVTMRLRSEDGFSPIAQVARQQQCFVDEPNRCEMCEGVCRECRERQGKTLDGVGCVHGGEMSCLHFVAIPIENRHAGPIGVICVVHGGGRMFEDTELHPVRILAQHVGYEVERVSMEARLQASQRLAFLGQLLAEFAHEARGSLAALRGLADAMEEELGEQERYQVFRPMLGRQIDRLGALVRDLLEMGREAERRAGGRSDAGTLLRSAVDYWKATSRYSGRPIEVFVSPEIDQAPISLVSARFEQALYNLLDNACQHSSGDSPVAVSAEGDEDGMVCFRVSDRGGGIPEEVRRRVFEPFFTTRPGGTGLGLVIVKHFAELNGGFVRIADNPDRKGAAVEIVLPNAELHGDVPDPDESTEHPQKGYIPLNR